MILSLLIGWAAFLPPMRGLISFTNDTLNRTKDPIKPTNNLKPTKDQNPMIELLIPLHYMRGVPEHTKGLNHMKDPSHTNDLHHSNVFNHTIEIRCLKDLNHTKDHNHSKDHSIMKGLLSSKCSNFLVILFIVNYDYRSPFQQPYASSYPRNEPEFSQPQPHSPKRPPHRSGSSGESPEPPKGIENTYDSVSISGNESPTQPPKESNEPELIESTSSEISIESIHDDTEGPVDMSNSRLSTLMNTIRLVNTQNDRTKSKVNLPRGHILEGDVRYRAKISPSYEIISRKKMNLFMEGFDQYTTECGEISSRFGKALEHYDIDVDSPHRGSLTYKIQSTKDSLISNHSKLDKIKSRLCYIFKPNISL
ncbi:hypothetical protein RF11_05346 [Thelohanellus kitauei]|uniref:Uncharacterized protein n=1 Tax=Thelohanellus kitauei TaxID=669202 RepID=A0A0C2NAY8_THEKT|nr:hypothetical protein RF11_05346 [Thelohanellus kitauei]